MVFLALISLIRMKLQFSNYPLINAYSMQTSKWISLIFSSWVYRGEGSALSFSFLSFIHHIIFWNFGIIVIMLETFYLITSCRGNESSPKNLMFLNSSLNLIGTCNLRDEEELPVPGRGNEMPGVDYPDRRAWEELREATWGSMLDSRAAVKDKWC